MKSIFMFLLCMLTLSSCGMAGRTLGTATRVVTAPARAVFNMDVQDNMAITDIDTMDAQSLSD